MQKSTREIFIKRAREVHGDKYDYSKVEYKNNKTKVCIVCSEHGEFWQNPNHHLSGQGCPYCSDRLHAHLSYDTEHFVTLAKAVHGDKYDYSQVEYKNARSYVSIVCPKHGVFTQKAKTHLEGRGCPKCSANRILHTKMVNGTFNSSNLQDVLHEKLVDIFGTDDVASEYSEDNRYPFNCDFYIKSKDLFIELNAHWTHGGHFFDEASKDDLKRLSEWKEKAKLSKYYENAIDVWTRRDIIKHKTAEKNNINYVVLWNRQDIADFLENIS